MRLIKSVKAAFDAANSPIATAATYAGLGAYLSRVCFKAGASGLGDAIAILAAVEVSVFNSRAINAWNNRPSAKIITLGLN